MAALCKAPHRVGIGQPVAAIKGILGVPGPLMPAQHARPSP